MTKAEVPAESPGVGAAPVPRFAPVLPARLDPRQLSAKQADWLIRLASVNAAGRLGASETHCPSALTALVRKGLASRDAGGWEITAAGRERCKSIY